MTKIDLRKEFRAEYVTPRQPELVKVGPAKYLTAEFQGEPGGEAFQRATEALYTAAYRIKFASKAASKDFKVSALEAQLWVDPKYPTFQDSPRDQLFWRLLIRVPAFISVRDLKDVTAANAKMVPGLEDLKVETISEGRTVQMLHVGPYAEEPATVRTMLDFVARQGLELCGLHHEIYLSDPHRVAPQKLRTILRLPVRPRR